jgi:hypothetical protein
MDAGSWGPENVISPESGQEHTRDGKLDGADDVDDEKPWLAATLYSVTFRPAGELKATRRSAVVDK